jgi:hypothetical protein
MASLPRPSPAYITHTRSRPPHRLSFDQTPSHQTPSKSPQANGLLSPGRKGQGFRLSTDFNLNSPQKTQPQSPIFRDDRSTRGLLRPSEQNSSSSTPINSALSSSAHSFYTPEKSHEDPPYNVFSRGKKRWMVYIVSLAAFFSPLSFNIYFPALGAISKGLGVSFSAASLTVTGVYGCPRPSTVVLGPLIRHEGGTCHFHRYVTHSNKART